MAKSRNLNVSITGDPRSFKRALTSVNKDLAHTEGRFKSFSKTGARAFGTVGVAAGGALAIGLTKAVSAFIEAEQVAAQTEARLKSTAGVANVTARSVSNLATAISRKSGIDDEAIQSAENLLLTFTKIRNESGAGNKVFDQATLAATNLSVALGKDLNSSALMVGKALNDPVRGVTALSRAGVQFTAGQKQTIASLIENNRVLDAQKLILGELQTQVGGSAEAYGNTFAGSIGKARTEVGNFGEQIGGMLAPSIQKATDQFARFVRQMQDGEGAGGDFGRRVKRAINDADDAIGSLTRRFRRLKDQGNTTGEAIGQMLSDGFQKAAPEIANAAGRAAPRAAGAFIRAFLSADAWGRFLVAGFLISKMGGFRAAGRWAGRTLGLTASANAGAALAGQLPASLGSRQGKIQGAMSKAGALAGRAFGVAAALYIGLEISNALGKLGNDAGAATGSGGSASLPSSGGPNSATRGGIGIGQRIARALGLGDAPGGGLNAVGGGSRTSGRSIPSLRTGRIAVAPGANRSGQGLNSGVRDLAKATSGVYGKTLTVGTGSNHSQQTVSGNTSDHWTGDGVDIPARGAALVRMGQSALIAAGADPAWARKQNGGLFNLTTPGGGRAQIIFNTQEGGDHTDHLHIGLKGKLGARKGGVMLGSLKGAATGARLTSAQRTIQSAAKAEGVDPAILYGIFGRESNFGRNKNTSSAGAQGPFQLMPATARSLGVKNPRDLGQAAAGAAKYFKQLLRMFDGDVELALAAYNAGPGAVKKAGGIPNFAETKAYVPGVLALAKKFPRADGTNGGFQLNRADRKQLNEQFARQLIAPILGQLRGRLGSANRIIGLTSTAESGFGSKLDLARTRHGFTEEDISTPEGRAARISELTVERGLTLNVGFQQGVRLTALRSAMRAVKAAIRKLQAKLKKAARGQRGVIRAEIAKKKADLKDLTDEARSLAADFAGTGAEWEGLGVEIGDTETQGVKDQAEREASERTELLGKNEGAVGDALELIDLQERAGELSPGDAVAARLSVINRALAGEFGELDPKTALRLKGDAREITEANTKALDAATEAINSLRDEVKRQNDFAVSVANITSAEAVRALSDVINGQIFGNVANRGLTAGAGSNVRY